MTLALLARTTEETAHHLPMPAWAFGVISLAFFLFLLLVTFAFRHAGTRHQD